MDTWSKELIHDERIMIIDKLQEIGWNEFDNTIDYYNTLLHDNINYSEYEFNREYLIKVKQKMGPLRFYQIQETFNMPKCLQKLGPRFNPHGSHKRMSGRRRRKRRHKLLYSSMILMNTLQVINPIIDRGQKRYSCWRLSDYTVGDIITMNIMYELERNCIARQPISLNLHLSNLQLQSVHRN